MTTKGERTRARLVESMLELIQHNGYTGTGLNAVTEHAAAPKGSLYFHFPEGKEGLGIAAVERAGSQFEALIAEASATSGSAVAVARTAITSLATLISQSDFRLGCPVSVVTLEMGAEHDGLRQACATAFSSWIAPTAALLEGNGLLTRDAQNLATVIISLVEGATIVSRATRSTHPLLSAADAVADLIQHRLDQAAGR